MRNLKKYFQKRRPTRCCETRNRQKTHGDASNGRIHERATNEEETRSETESNSHSSHLESDLQATPSTTTTTTTNRTEVELQEDAIRLHDVPRDQWPADVLTYQRDVDRNRKRKAAEMQAEDDRLRREVEQQRRQEQLAKMAADAPDEQRYDPRIRAASKAASYKRQRQSEVDAANVVPADLMNDEEIDAARTAPLTAPNEAQKQHIVNRTRAALSDAHQGQRVCAVCDECVFKNESRLGPSVLSVDREIAAAAMFRRSSTTAAISTPRSSLTQYDCSQVHRGFEGVLLSRTAFETAARHEVERAANANIADLPCVCGKQSHSATVYNNADVDLQLLRVVADAKHFGQQRRRRRTKTKKKEKKRKEKKTPQIIFSVSDL